MLEVKHMINDYVRHCVLARLAMSAALVVVLSFSFIRTSEAIVAPLEILQPRAGLDINNRFYRAYPGLPFEVQIAAIGGLYPNRYELVSGPAGVAVDAATGVLSWSSPTTNGSPHSISVSVTDSNGTKATVSWTVTVTTNGFRFVDAVNGKSAANGGTGSIESPWRSIADWYISKYDTSQQGVFLYYRTGTYYVKDAPIEDPNGFRRLALPGHKPMVWLAYPGERPIIDTGGSHVSPYGGCRNVYFEGLRFQNYNTHFGIRIDSDASNVTFRKNIFGPLELGWGGLGTNASALMISKGGSVGSHWVIADNTFEGVKDNGYGILGYWTTKTLVQGNSFFGIAKVDGKGIGPKEATNNWFIRDNRIDATAGEAINVQASGAGTAGGQTANIEIAYNRVRSQSGYTLWIGAANVDYGLVESYRNTYVGAPVSVANLTNARGPVTFRDDVIVNSSTSPSRIDRPNDTSSPSRVTSTGLLTGTMSDGIVDANGNLSDQYGQYRGLKGFERVEAGTRPRPPAGVAAD